MLGDSFRNGRKEGRIGDLVEDARKTNFVLALDHPSGYPARVDLARYCCPVTRLAKVGIEVSNE